MPKCEPLTRGEQHGQSILIKSTIAINDDGRRMKNSSMATSEKCTLVSGEERKQDTIKDVTNIQTMFVIKKKKDFGVILKNSNLRQLNCPMYVSNTYIACQTYTTLKN